MDAVFQHQRLISLLTHFGAPLITVSSGSRFRTDGSAPDRARKESNSKCRHFSSRRVRDDLRPHRRCRVLIPLSRHDQFHRKPASPHTIGSGACFFSPFEGTRLHQGNDTWFIWTLQRPCLRSRPCSRDYPDSGYRRGSSRGGSCTSVAARFPFVRLSMSKSNQMPMPSVERILCTCERSFQARTRQSVMLDCVHSIANLCND